MKIINIIKYDIKLPVSVRKYDVDIEKLKTTLRDSKSKTGLSNKQVSELLNRPRTEVEHWFRRDSCFSIPLPEIWLQLKEVLDIKTDVFDIPIMTFEERDGSYDLANRLYDSEGITPTLTAASEVLIIFDENILTKYKGDGKLNNQINFNKKVKTLSLFSGIGAFEKALENIGIDTELVGFSEIDKYAIKSFCAIHNINESLNFGDVSKINKSELPDFDLLVGGSPCQAFSVAGHRKGFEDTRGTLFFQYVETLKHKQPKFFVYENVKGLINHDKGNTLDTIAQSFSEVGYRIDIELLNSKFFNVPQNRERIYIVGIREDLIENKDWIIDEKRNGVLMNGKRRLKELGIKSFIFKYPEQLSVNLRLREILEDKVDEKFYLSEDKTNKLTEQLEKRYTEPFIMDGKNCFGNNHKIFDKGIAPTCLSNDYKEPKKVVEPLIDGCNMLGRLEMKGNDSLKRVYDPDGMSPTLTTMGGGNTEPKIAIEDIQCLNTYTNGTQTQQQDRVYNPEGQMVALTSSLNGRFNIVEDEVRAVLTPDREEKRQEGRRFKENDEPSFTVNTIYRHGVATGNYPKYRIRKLTPLECFRLQAFSDEDYQNCVDIGISNSQLYKQAGNSITVTVLEEIFKELFNTYGSL